MFPPSPLDLVVLLLLLYPSSFSFEAVLLFSGGSVFLIISCFVVSFHDLSTIKYIQNDLRTLKTVEFFPRTLENG